MAHESASTVPAAQEHERARATGLSQNAPEPSGRSAPQGQRQPSLAGGCEVSSRDLRSDFELFDLWTAGDRLAGAELFERHFDSVYRFFRTKVNTEIDDLVQQTFLACLEARARYRREASFRTFLLAIARYELFEHYRRVATVSAFDFTTASISGLSTSPSGLLTQQDDEKVLALALQKLPVDLQIALELVYWEGLDGPEIARVLDVPLNTIYSRLRRAKELLREAVDDEPISRIARAMLEDLESWANRVRPGTRG